MKKYLLALGALILPASAFAANDVVVATDNLNNAIQNVTRTVNLLVPLLLAVAIVFFIVGVIRYIIAKGPEDAKKGRDLIIWSIIGLASILAVWGLARLLVNFFGLSPSGLDTNLIPQVPVGTLNGNGSTGCDPTTGTGC